jgi:hypothetical protein
MGRCLNKNSSRSLASESQIHEAVCAHLRSRAVPGLEWWHTPNGGLRGIRKARRFKLQGVTAGVADLCMFYVKQFYALELKTVRGRLTPEQKSWLDRMTSQGAVCAVAYGLDQALSTLESWKLIKSLQPQAKALSHGLQVDAILRR